MKNKILEWFCSGETGLSSKTMACCFADMPQHPKWGINHPHDPDDFRRCLLFLEAAPECRENMEKLKSLSPQWGKLVDNWDKIEELFMEECGSLYPKPGTNAPKTYELIKDLDYLNPPNWEAQEFLSNSPYGSRNTNYLFQLFDGVTDCPVCILSAIRQSKREYSDVDEEGYHSFSFEFDFEAAKKIFWEK